MAKLRVVVIGTGNIGGIAVRCLQGRADVELVGVRGRTQNVGIDAGLLDTDEPCGVIVTGNEEDICALKPDCAVMALNIRDPMEAQKVNEVWHLKLLERGINVVTASDGSLVFPPSHMDQSYVARLKAAALGGGVTFYANGQEPGFVDHMALLAATLNDNKTKCKHNVLIASDEALTLRVIRNRSTLRLLNSKPKRRDTHIFFKRFS